MAVQTAGLELLVQNGYTFTRHTQLRMNELMRVIRLYLRFNTAAIGHMSLGADVNTLKYPALFLEPGPDASEIEEIGGPMTLNLSGTAHMYFVGNDRQRLAELVGVAQDVLRKVFSNNADNNLTTAGRTDRWKANPTMLGTGDFEAAAWYEITVSFTPTMAAKYGRRPEEELIRGLRMNWTIKALTFV